MAVLLFMAALAKTSRLNSTRRPVRIKPGRNLSTNITTPNCEQPVSIYKGFGPSHHPRAGAAALIVGRYCCRPLSDHKNKLYFFIISTYFISISLSSFAHFIRWSRSSCVSTFESSSCENNVCSFMVPLPFFGPVPRSGPFHFFRKSFRLCE